MVEDVQLGSRMGTRAKMAEGLRLADTCDLRIGYTILRSFDDHVFPLWLRFMRCSHHLSCLTSIGQFGG